MRIKVGNKWCLALPYTGYIETTKNPVKPTYRLTEEAKDLIEAKENGQISKLEYTNKYNEMIKKETWYLRSKTGNLIQTNSKTAGKPRRKTINGQHLYNGTVFEQARNNYVEMIKHQVFKSQITKEELEFLKTLDLRNYEMTICAKNLDVSAVPDITNLWIIPKIFDDFLQDMNVIENDNKEFREGYSIKFTDEDVCPDHNLLIYFNEL